MNGFRLLRERDETEKLETLMMLKKVLYWN